MSIDKDLARIADALEKIAASAGRAAVNVTTTCEAPAGGKPAAKTEAKEKPAEAPDLKEVVAALQGYMKANGREAAVELLAKFGAKRASDIDEARRADFIKEAS